MPRPPVHAFRRHELGTDAASASDSVLSFLKAHTGRHGTAPGSSVYLSGPDEHDRVELSEELFAALKQAATVLSQGKSISIHARDEEVSTQQAAELLGLSRPTVVRLIQDGEIPAHVPGTVRRRLRLADVLEYRAALHEQRSEFIARSSEDYAIDDDIDLSDVIHNAERGG